MRPTPREINDDVRAVKFLIATYRNGHRTMPPIIEALERRLHLYRTMTADGLASALPTAESPVWIGSHLAAAILGWSQRRVLRHASDLDGEMWGDRWRFPAHAVHAYKMELEREDRNNA